MSKSVEIRGNYEAQFEPVVELFKSQIRSFGGGAAVCVYLDGTPVVDVWGGRALADGTPWQRETMSICYSGTKGVTSTALHMLATEGRIDYDAPVADYWPEFGCNGKERITVRQVLSHQAGLHRLRPLVDRITDILDWDLVVSRLEQTEPDFDPGTANAYQAVTFGWLVGELVRRVSGLSVPEFVRRRLVEPMNLDGLFIGEADVEMDRLPDFVGLPPLQRNDPRQLTMDYRVPFWVRTRAMRDLWERGLTPKNAKQLYTHPSFWKACLPAMNGVATARSLARMYAALAMGGELEGTRLVSQEVIERASEVQTRRADKVVFYPLHWKLGYHRTDALLMDVPEAFGHFGLGGAGGWANPSLRLSFGFLHNGFPLTVRGQIRNVTMTAAVYESLGIYKGLCHTLVRGPMVDLIPRRS
jgi:CubicO group peptidase (beta-lactamase class C family)